MSSIEIYSSPQSFDPNLLIVKGGTVHEARERDGEVYPALAKLHPDFKLVRFDEVQSGGFRLWLIHWNNGQPLVFAAARCLSRIDNALEEGAIPFNLPTQDNHFRRRTNFDADIEHGTDKTDPRWNGVKTFEVVLLKDSGLRYVRQEDLGCSKNWDTVDDEEAVRLFLAEHGCRLVTWNV